MSIKTTPTFTCIGPGSGVIPGTPIAYDCGTSDPGSPPPAPAPAPSPAPPPPPPTTCSADQRSVPWGLTRQCEGFVTYQGGAPVTGGPLTPNLADLLGGGTWLNYAGMQWAWWIPITTGSYISFAFVPTHDGILNFNADPTFGTGGIISVSTTPGDFSSSAVCVRANYGSNNLPIGDPAVCPLAIGQTYYLNIASVHLDGTPVCYGIKPWLPQTCAVSTISYIAN